MIHRGLDLLLVVDLHQVVDEDTWFQGRISDRLNARRSKAKLASHSDPVLSISGV